MRNISTSRHKKGFALVTVLFLMLGVSLAAAGLTYKIIKDARLINIWENRDMAFSTAETGIEAGKRWLLKAIEGDLPTGNQTGANNCLKGFKDNEGKQIEKISLVYQKNESLSYELSMSNVSGENQDPFKDSSYEYFIANVTSEYQTQKNEQEDNKSYLYTWNWHTTAFVYDALTGKNSEKHPEAKGIFTFGVKRHGFRPRSVSSPEWFIDEDYLYMLNSGNWTDAHIYVVNKWTGKPSAKHPKLRNNWQNRMHKRSGFKVEPYPREDFFFIDDDYLYRRLQGYVFVYDKMTGKNSDEHPDFFYKGKKYSGYTINKGVRSNKFIIDGQYLYDTGGSGDVRVYDKMTGKNSTRHPSYYGKSGFRMHGVIGDYEAIIDDDSMYVHAGRGWSGGGKEIMLVFDKMTGKRPPKFKPTIRRGTNWFIRKDLPGFFVNYSTNWNIKKEFFIKGDKFYKVETTRLFWHFGGCCVVQKYNKMTGKNLGEEFIITGDYGHYRPQIWVDGTETKKEQTDIFRIYSCGHNNNNIIRRVEAVFSINKAKEIKQISWKEHF